MFKLVFFHFAFENKIHTKALIYEYTFVESIIKRSLKNELTFANLRAGGILALLRLSLTCFPCCVRNFVLCTVSSSFVY